MSYGRWQKYGKKKCEECGSLHEGLPIEIEGAGDRDAEYLVGYAVLETEPCHADDCTKRLCPDCPQFVCESCGLTHCDSHKTIVDGYPTCDCCLADAIAQGAAELAEASNA